MSAIILLAVFGCHGNPSTPDPGLILGESRNLAQGNQLNHVCLGSYDVTFDPVGMEAEILPDRSSDLHLNLTKIFVNTLNLSIALIPGESDPPNGVFAVDFTITHPFTTETEFTIFDVKGIVMTPGTFPIGSTVFTGPSETRVDNADGYTRWWNPGEFTQPGIFGYMDGLFTNTTGGLLTANINPYKYFADILDPTDSMQPVYSEMLTSDNGRGVFKTGSINTRRYIVKFQMLPSPDFRFSYVIDGCWAIPDPNPPSAVPDDFPIQANQAEAFHLALAKKADTLYYSSNSGTGAGVLKLQVNVHDWQGQDSGDIASQVGSVKVYAPDLFPGGIEMTYLDQTPVKARYTVDLTGIAIPTEAGESLLAVEVVSSGGPAYDQGLSYPAPTAPLAAWQVLILDIPDLNCHGDANNDFADAFEINYGSTINDQVCLPDDYRDFYFFEIPSGFEVSGDIDLHCDAGPTKLGLYDPDQNLIIETDVVAGLASIDVDSLNLMPETYYVRVYTSNPTELAPYELDFNVTATDVTPNPVALTSGGLYVNPQKIWWEGDYIYLLNSRFLWIYDMTIPSNPVQVFKKRGSFGPKTLSAHYGNFIYYISYSEPELGQINMIDVSNKSNPVFHDNVAYLGYDVGDICMNSSRLFVADFGNPVATHYTIFNWSTDPLFPFVAGSFGSPIIDVIQLDLMYPEETKPILISANQNIFNAIDVENSSSTIFLDSHSTADIHELAISDKYVIATGSNPNVTDGMFILEFDLLTGFSELGETATPGTACYIDTEWPYAYIGDHTGGMATIDLTNPGSPTLLTSVPLVSLGIDLAVNGDTLCIIPFDAGMQVFNVSNPVSPIDMGRLEVINTTGLIFIDGDYLYTGEFSFGYNAIKIVNISDPGNIFLETEYLTSLGKINFLAYDNGRMAALVGTHNWEFLNVSNPALITQIASGSLPNPTRTMNIYNDYLYITTEAGFATLHTHELNMFDPPVLVNSITLPGTDPACISFYGDYMIIPTCNIEIYSLLNPAQPNHVSTYVPSIPPSKAVVQNDIMYIAAFDRIEIVDASNMLNLTFINSVLLTSGLPYYLLEIEVDGQFAYASGISLVYLSNVWPPEEAVSLGILFGDEGYYTTDMVIVDDLIYLASGNVGLSIYDLY
jgi:hypothetical protein